MNPFRGGIGSDGASGVPDRDAACSQAMPEHGGARAAAACAGRRCLVRSAAAVPMRLAAAAMVAILLFGAGCDCEDEDRGWEPDWRAPAAPQGFWSRTGDREVALFWYSNMESDLEGYRIYRSTEPRGYFPRIATVGAGARGFLDRDVTNGVTYYYAIAAFDRSGNESELASEEVFDTPRPEGRNLRLRNADVGPEDSGYDFSAYRVIDFRDLEADIYYWQTEDAGAWMIATERSDDSYTDIQDAGYRPLHDVDWAPEDGWAEYGEVPLIVGHSYVVWTWDNHFAKFRVVDIHPDRVLVDWAYQTDRGNPELLLPVEGAPAKRPGGGQREHQRGIARRSS